MRTPSHLFRHSVQVYRPRPYTTLTGSSPKDLIPMDTPLKCKVTFDDGSEAILQGSFRGVETGQLICSPNADIQASDVIEYKNFKYEVKNAPNNQDGMNVLKTVILERLQ